MKKKISELHKGDIVEIKGKYFDIYDEPNRLENGAYLFAIVSHGEMDKVDKMTYVTPADLAYDISMNFQNEEIDIITEDEIKERNETALRGLIAQLEDDWEDRMSAYRPFCGW